MKVLVVNDNPAINTIIEQILTDDGHIIASVTKLDDAVKAVESFKPEMIVLEETVDGSDSMTFVDLIDSDSGIKLIILSSGKKPLPKDKPMIVDVIRKPFKSEELLTVVRNIDRGVLQTPSQAAEPEVPKKRRSRFLGGREEEQKPEDAKPEDEYALRFGKSYIVYEDRPDAVYLVTSQFIPQGGDLFVLSFDRPKTIQEAICSKVTGGVDMRDNIETMCISASRKYGTVDATKLGTIMSSIMKFIDQAVRPVIVIDDLTKVIEANDINLALMFVCQIFSGTSKNFTMVISVKEKQFTDKDKNLLSRYMGRYNFDLEEPVKE